MFQTQIKIRIVNSLEKVLPRDVFDAVPSGVTKAARGETAAFQVAVCSVTGKDGDQDFIHATLELEPTPLAKYVAIRAVGNVGCIRPTNNQDPFVISSKPGLYPDPLLPKNEIWLQSDVWSAYWIDFSPDDSAPAGRFTLGFKLVCREGAHEEVLRVEAEVEVLDFTLPTQTLKCIMWFYPDCLQKYYGVEPWCERHWEIVGNYMRDRVRHGINVVFTPLWSVPLDTAVGGERPTCQLLDISFADGTYAFDFSRLDRWIALARKCGTEYFEMSHAYTQWGAAHAPKIIVRENGAEIRKFGWETDACGEAYRDFLRQLMAALLPFLRSRGVTPANCYFHVSDEPTERVIENYAKAAGFFRSIIGDYPVIDALSHVEFFRRKLIDRPIPVTNSLGDFLGENVAERWVYYCGNWANGVPNRQIGMPSMRNRVLGTLLYRLEMDGFLNWGYNFWFSRESLNQDLDPWYDVCAGGDFAGGGSFVVYPGRDGQPVSSIHYEVFMHGLQDMRALQLLESRIGREKTVALICSTLPGGDDIGISRYPHSDAWLLDLRERVNQAILASIPDAQGGK